MENKRWKTGTLKWLLKINAENATYIYSYDVYVSHAWNERRSSQANEQSNENELVYSRYIAQPGCIRTIRNENGNGNRIGSWDQNVAFKVSAGESERKDTKSFLMCTHSYTVWNIAYGTNTNEHMSCICTKQRRTTNIIIIITITQKHLHQNVIIN